MSAVKSRRLYLITGFLGSGKTTFLKHFIHLFAGQKIQLIVNEFGREGVDGALLSDLGAHLDEISGGSVFCSCRMDQFEKRLQESESLDTDVILVEASGLSDPTGVRRLFFQSGRFPWIEYRGALCLVDAVRFPKLYATAHTCLKQLASSDVAIVNKTDLADEAQLSETLACIRGQRPDMTVVLTRFGAVDESLLEKLDGARSASKDEMPLSADLTLRKMAILLSPAVCPDTLRRFIEMFCEYSFRVKGFVQTNQGLMLADCVGNVVSLSPWEGATVPQERIGWLNVLPGAGMPLRKAVKTACEWYAPYILKVE